jgi:hypothetical protein
MFRQLWLGFENIYCLIAEGDRGGRLPEKKSRKDKIKSESTYEKGGFKWQIQ